MKAWVCVASILSVAAACIQEPYRELGYELPVECQGDKLDVEYTLVTLSPHALNQLARAKGAARMNKRVLGLTVGDLIYIDNTLTGWTLQAVLRHEKCHVAYGAWHGK